MDTPQHEQLLTAKQMAAVLQLPERSFNRISSLLPSIRISPKRTRFDYGQVMEFLYSLKGEALVTHE